MPQTEQSEIQIDANKVISHLRDHVGQLHVELATGQALLDQLTEQLNASTRELAEAKSTIDTLSESLHAARNQAEEPTDG